MLTVDKNYVSSDHYTKENIMTTNNEFFKKTQENLRRIKAENNKKTLRSYNIDGKAEGETEQKTTTTSRNNVISLADYKKNKAPVQPVPEKVELSVEDRYKRISESIQRINKLMTELESTNKREIK